MNNEKMPPVLEKLISDFERDFNELWSTGEIQAAKEINKSISDGDYKLRHDCLPGPFFGDLMAEYVVVNLNPGIGSGQGDTKEKLIKDKITDFKSYYKHLRYYGEERYGELNDESPDPFDVKMVGFLKPFDELLDNQFSFIKMEDEEKTVKLRGNLRKVMDNKCQLEFIKYGSRKFDSSIFLKQPWVRERMEEILDYIFCTKRKRVIFNGTIFKDILKKMRNENIKFIKVNRCRLYRNEKELCSRYSYYEVYEITRFGQTIKCIINRAFQSREFQSYKSRGQFAKFIIENEFADEIKE